jgi:hypothetical protein
VSLAPRSRASGSDSDHSLIGRTTGVSLEWWSRASCSNADDTCNLAAWLIPATTQYIKSSSPRGRPRRVMPCLYSLGLCLPFRLSPSGLCSHANLSSCPSARTPPLALTLSTHFSVKLDVPNYVGLDRIEHILGCPHANLPSFPCSVACEDIKSTLEIILVVPGSVTFRCRCQSAPCPLIHFPKACWHKTEHAVAVRLGCLT